VHWASGVKSLTTGLKSMSDSPASIRAICAWQLAMSCSDCALVKNVMMKILVCWRTPRSVHPKRRTAQGPRGTEQANHETDTFSPIKQGIAGWPDGVGPHWSLGLEARAQWGPGNRASLIDE
jgi:hypothetical protein